MFADLSTPFLFGLFIFSGAIIAWSGTKMAAVAEAIALKTGWGQAIVGAVFVGASTSLSGTVLSVSAAAEGHPDLSISNAIGGIAAQTLFLALVDMTYRKANLEHAAATLENLGQAALLIVLLCIPVFALMGPDIGIGNIHIVSFLLVIIYIGGIRLVRAMKSEPMWAPKQTKETQQEKQVLSSGKTSLKKLLMQFLGLAGILGGAGYLLARSSIILTEKSGFSETIVGGLFTSITTSLPELITAFAAVRRGALNLALGDIIGGNSFDILFLTASDIAYREGSLYHQMTSQHILIIMASLLMTGILMLGLLRREKSGIGGIGFESILIIIVYAVMASFILMH